MNQVLAPLTPSTTIVFRDGLGERRRVTDPTGRESVDLWYLNTELTGLPAVEAALRDRVSRLAGFRHPSVNHVLSVDRVNSGATLAVISDSAPGVRLSDLLAAAEKHRLPLDINTALYMIRQLVPAIAALHAHDHEIAHGALAPERIVITPRAQLTVVDHAAGSALEHLKFSHQRYWKDLRVALPRSAGLPHFDHRVDVMQIGVVALSLILGRLIHDDEYPAKLPELVGSAWAISDAGDLQPLPPGMRAWLSRALQIDLRHAFTTAAQASAEFDRMLSADGHAAEPAGLERFLARYYSHVPQDQPQIPAAPSPVVVPAALRVERPAEPAAAAPRSPYAIPRIEPAPTVEAPRPVTENAPLRADTGSRPVVEAAMPRNVVEMPGPRLVEPVNRFDVTSRSVVEPAPSRVTAPPRTDAPSRFDLTPRTVDAVAPRIEFTSSDVEAHEMPKPAPAAMSRKSMVVAAAVVLVALAGGGIVAARRYAAAGAGAAAGTGTLTVNSNPTGAQVVVDGESKGVTPTTLTLQAGTHALELRGVGEPRTMSVAVTAGAQLSQYIELANGPSTMGKLQIRTDPPGALVTIDALPRGTSPITIGNLDPGEHAVVLTSDAGSVTQSVTIEAGTTSSLVVPLAVREASPQSGWLSVSSPVDVQLFENGRLLGSSQSDRIMVPSGTHQIDLVNDTLGYRMTRSVQVTPGKVASVAVKLPMGSVAINAIPWAEVWIDGTKVGETPIGNLPTTIGSHEIVFRNPEFGEKLQVVTVTLTAPARLSVDMRKK
jgi:serine/threonine protein kinase